jgi:hypothetical protein
MSALDPDRFLKRVIAPTLALLGSVMSKRVASDEAKVMILAIMLQESRLEHRRQLNDAGKETGPARGFAQFEQGGGVKGVMEHPYTIGAARGLCDRLCVTWDQADVYEAIAWHDVLAVGFARLLLYSDPNPLPELGDEQAAWDYYLKLWRPGQPHPETWPLLYAQALAAVASAPRPGSKPRAGDWARRRRLEPETADAAMRGPEAA